MTTKFVLVTGEPGSGKTTLGIAIAHALRVPFFSRDQVRGGMLATAGIWTGAGGTLSPREAAVEALTQLVEKTGELGISAVVEFVVLPERADAWRRMEAAGTWVVVRTECADAAARARARDLVDPLLSRSPVLAALGHDSVVSYLEATDDRNIASSLLRDFAVPLLSVCTDDGYDPPLPDIVDWIVDQTC